MNRPNDVAQVHERFLHMRLPPLHFRIASLSLSPAHHKMHELPIRISRLLLADGDFVDAGKIIESGIESGIDGDVIGRLHGEARGFACHQRRPLNSPLAKVSS
jgi:hypothetical protein